MTGGRRRFARAPRRGVSSLPSERLALLDRLERDARFRALPTRSREALRFAVQRYADREGRFWPKAARWAEEMGVSRATVWRAVADAKAAAGLIETEPYLRPDGLQGATTYLLDLALVHPTRCRSSDTPCPTGCRNGETPCPAADGSGRQGVAGLRQRQGVSPVATPERSSNGKAIGKGGSEEEAVANYERREASSGELGTLVDVAPSARRPEWA